MFCFTHRFVGRHSMPWLRVKNICFQMIAVILISVGLISVTDLHGLFGACMLCRKPCNTSSHFCLLPRWSMPTTLIDGVDGLAGGIACIVSAVFAVLFYFAHDTFFCALSVILTASLIRFLQFNFNPAKIFMGDTGSLMLGFCSPFWNSTYRDTRNIRCKGCTSAIHSVFSSDFCSCSVFDTIRVFSIRMAKGYSPFRADRRHLHHLLQKTHWSQWVSASQCIPPPYFLLCCPGSSSRWIPHSPWFYFRLRCCQAETLTVAVIRSRKKLEKAAVNIEDYRKHNQFC